MSRRDISSSAAEFPLMSAYGVYAAKVNADGNCLFNSLSDQMFGHEGVNLALRKATVDHMRANPSLYRDYIPFEPPRRNPRRSTATARAVSPPIDLNAYIEDNVQRNFEQYLAKMARPGEWGDNTEIVAFASQFNVHVRVWMRDNIHLFSPLPGCVVVDHDVAVPRIFEVPDGHELPTLHVAYHDWYHYSSVRDQAGPRTGQGLPQVSVSFGVTSPSPSDASPESSSTASRKRSSVERDDSDDSDAFPRATKRRSPLPLFDSDSTPISTPATEDSSEDDWNPRPFDRQARANSLARKKATAKRRKSTSTTASSRADSPLSHQGTAPPSVCEFAPRLTPDRTESPLPAPEDLPASIPSPAPESSPSPAQDSPPSPTLASAGAAALSSDEDSSPSSVSSPAGDDTPPSSPATTRQSPSPPPVRATKTSANVAGKSAPRAKKGKGNAGAAAYRITKPVSKVASRSPSPPGKKSLKIYLKLRNVPPSPTKSPRTPTAAA